MQLQRIYPLPTSSAGSWRAYYGDYDFMLIRADKGWVISSLARGMNLLVKHDLLRQTFTTRREALASLEGMLIAFGKTS